MTNKTLFFKQKIQSLSIIIGQIANFLVVAGSYGYAFLLDNDDDDDGEESNGNKPEWLKFIYKSLDFGSGRERGARQ